MHIFKILDPYCSKDDFLFNYGQEAKSRTSECTNAHYNGCKNSCDYLISGSIEATRDGYPAVFGQNCDVDVLSWGGDIDDVSVDTYCKDCAIRRS